MEIIKQRDSQTDLEGLINLYRQIPVESIIKQDILRLGLNFEASALRGEDYKKKDYFIFTFDRVPLAEQSESIRFRAPEEIKVSGGHFDLKTTVISVRINPDSPYIVKYNGKHPILYRDTLEIGRVVFPPVPDYYKHTLSSGKPVGEIAPVIEWGYLIYLTVFRNCQYFGKDEECAFCDINHNYRQQKNEGRPYTGVKSPEEILEVLSLIDKQDSIAKCYTITGGSVIKKLKNKNEVDFYYEYVKKIEEKFPGRWIGKIVAQAWEKEELQRFKDAGIKIYHPNYEIWDRDIFSVLCPGKTRFVGRDTWIRRIIDATEIFGPENVIPNFVGGVELSRPYGFKNIAEAIRSTTEGIDYFMRHGVVPRFTTWCPEPFTALGQQTGPPLEYFCKLLTNWKLLFEKYALPIPPGYGEAGPGRAVFSVSAFMDVIGYNGR